MEEIIMYIYKWIEGYENLKEYCMRWFKGKPLFCETIGYCGYSKIYLIYKYKDDNNRHKGCAEMYFLFMEHHSGTKSWPELQEIMSWSYEKIKADKSSLLK